MKHAPSERLSTSIVAMFTFIVSVTIVEAIVVGTAAQLFDIGGTTKFVLGLAVFIVAVIAGILVLRQIERRSGSSPQHLSSPRQAAGAP